LPKAKDGQEPLPEAIWWLLCTGDIPDQKQVNAISKEWASRASLPQYVVQLLDNFPSHLHPMAQFASVSFYLKTL
jgi:citrate synthase